MVQIPFASDHLLHYLHAVPVIFQIAHRFEFPSVPSNNEDFGRKLETQTRRWSPPLEWYASD